MPIEIDDIAPSARTIEIVHPATKEQVGIRVDLVSLDDEKLTSIKRKIQDRKNYLEARGKTFKAEEIEENQIELINAALTNWDWYDALYKGKKPDFNRKNVREILTAKAWLRQQLAEEIGDTEAFFTVELKAS